MPASPTKKRPPGRPKMGYRSILTRIEETQYDALKALSAETGAPMNHLVRRALALYLKKGGKS